MYMYFAWNKCKWGEGEHEVKFYNNPETKYVGKKYFTRYSSQIQYMYFTWNNHKWSSEENKIQQQS